VLEVWRKAGIINGRLGAHQSLDEDLRESLAKEVDTSDIRLHTCMFAASTAVAGCFVASGSVKRITHIRVRNGARA
jgi:hypothetical protein